MPIGQQEFLVRMFLNDTIILLSEAGINDLSLISEEWTKLYKIPVDA